ncbi:MAG: hypothetical protein AAFX78_12800 [Cyanobacteria bacterium J06638_20]
MKKKKSILINATDFCVIACNIYGFLQDCQGHTVPIASIASCKSAGAIKPKTLKTYAARSAGGIGF